MWSHQNKINSVISRRRIQSRRNLSAIVHRDILLSEVVISTRRDVGSEISQLIFTRKFEGNQVLPWEGLPRQFRYFSLIQWSFHLFHLTGRELFHLGRHRHIDENRETLSDETLKIRPLMWEGKKWRKHERLRRNDTMETSNILINPSPPFLCPNLCSLKTCQSQSTWNDSFLCTSSTSCLPFGMTNDLGAVPPPLRTPDEEGADEWEEEDE